MQVGDEMFLKVSLMKSIVRFGTKGKLSLRYSGPYVFITRVGALAYQLQLIVESVVGVNSGVSCLSVEEILERHRGDDGS
jgi:hypothetical protein